MTVGIYGGSFDPIHIGHLAIATFAADSGIFDEVWMMVSPLNPLKGNRPPLFPDRQRLEMVRLATDTLTGVNVSDFEMNLPIPSYSFRTLSELSKTFPDKNFRLITGADNLHDFHLWRNSSELLRNFGLTVFPRPGVDVTPSIITEIENRHHAPGTISYMSDAPRIDISSTQIRDMLTAAPYDTRLDSLIPEAALRFIRTEGINTSA